MIFFQLSRPSGKFLMNENYSKREKKCYNRRLGHIHGKVLFSLLVTFTKDLEL
jgi:hypothetical protein